MGSKRLHNAVSLVDLDRFYSVTEALELIKKFPKVKFDETVDIAIDLNVDPRHADQMVRGVFRLPNSLGKIVKIAAIVSEKYEEVAKQVGADFVGGENLIEKIKTNGVFFDRCVATMDIMSKVGKVAKILGPKGLMPNPKLGTATNDIEAAVKNLKQGMIEYRVEKAGIIHAGIAKVSFSADAIRENLVSFVEEIQKAKPTGAKGSYFTSIHLSTTMGPSLRLDIQDVLSASV